MHILVVSGTGGPGQRGQVSARRPHSDQRSIKQVFFSFDLIIDNRSLRTIGKNSLYFVFVLSFL